MTTLAQMIERLPAERRRKVESETTRLVEEERVLRSLRKARHYTQQSLARLMDTDQARISKIENSSDLLLSTLSSYVKAMGGTLKLKATFPEGSAEFESLSNALDLGPIGGGRGRSRKPDKETKRKVPKAGRSAIVRPA